MSKLQVVGNDPAGADSLPKGFRVWPVETPVSRLGERVCILTTLTKLGDVAATIHALKDRLKALLVRMDADALFLPQLLSQARIRALRRVLVYTDPALPARILNAWGWGSEDELIAAATVIGDRLLIVSCAMTALEVPFDALTPLRMMPEEERGRFEIDEDGAGLHWPGPDIDLDMEAFWYVVDPAYRKKVDAATLRYYVAYGNAIAKVRKRHGLTQAGVDGLSERQVRRIEQGEQYPTLKALESLAAAHGMPLNAYLTAVAEAARAATQGQAA